MDFGVVVAILALAYGGGVAAWLIRRWRDPRRKLTQLRPTLISRAADGAVASFVGRVRFSPTAGAPLVAPLSRRPCVGWRVVVASEQTRKVWDDEANVFERSAFQEFVIEDSEGTRALVRGAQDTELLRLDVDLSRELGLALLTDGPPRMADLFDHLELPMPKSSTVIDRVIDAQEAALEEGSKVMVVGELRRSGDVYRGGALEFEIVPAKGLEMIVTDDPAVVGY